MMATSIKIRKSAICVGLVLTIILSFSIAGSSPINSAVSDTPPRHHLTVLFTNDTHGHPIKFSNHTVPDVGGLPARATVVKEIRKTNPNVLLLDAGDLNTGQSISNFFKAKPDILGYNFMGYDAMAVGNHEFDHPVDVLREQMALARFPFLSANVKDQNGELLVTPYIIKQFSGFKVAVFGLTATETMITGNPDHVKGLIFENEIEVAKELVPLLREQADVVIALTHLGIYEGRNRGSENLAAQVNGIDLIVDGHTHTKIETPLIISNSDSTHETLIVQAWQWGLFLGRIDLWIQNKAIVDFKMEMIPINLKRIIKKPTGEKIFQLVGEPIQEDPELLALLQTYADKVDLFLNERVGESEGPFENDDGRYRETPLGDLVADAMRWCLRRFKPDFALTNSGAIRSGIPEGTLTRETIYNALPFDSTVVFLKLTGTQMKALFEYIGTIEPGEGAFPQVSKGVRFSLEAKKKTCKGILINGRPIDEGKSYGIVTNSYLAKGGDGYNLFLAAIDSFDSFTYQRDAMIAYIRHLGGKIVPEVQHRIALLP